MRDREYIEREQRLSKGHESIDATLIMLDLILEALLDIRSLNENLAYQNDLILREMRDN
jgi:hypothetical protein